MTKLSIQRTPFPKTQLMAVLHPETTMESTGILWSHRSRAFLGGLQGSEHGHWGAVGRFWCDKSNPQCKNQVRTLPPVLWTLPPGAMDTPTTPMDTPTGPWTLPAPCWGPNIGGPTAHGAGLDHTSPIPPRLHSSGKISPLLPHFLKLPTSALQTFPPCSSLTQKFPPSRCSGSARSFPTRARPPGRWNG